MRQQFDVAERVRQVIGAAGCTQREFARRVVMDPSKLSRSLSGSRRFTVAELARIADAGNVDAGWLLGTTAVGGAAAGAGAPRPPAAPPEGGRPLQIVRETVRLIAERGFHAVRVADIAAACDTSTATIHYHFPGRAELLEAAVRWCMDEDTARRAARIAEADDAREELRQLIALQVPHTERQRRQWLVWLDLWAEAARSTAIGRLHADFYRQWRQTVADVIRRGIEQGVFRAVDPEYSALRLTALIDGLATQVLATAPGAGGTSAEDMDIACNAYVDTELSEATEVTARRPGADRPGPASRPGAKQPGPPDQPGTDRPGPASRPGTEQPGPPDQPGTDRPGPPDQPGTDRPGPASRPGAKQPGPPDQPGTEQPGPPDQPGTDRPGPASQPGAE